MPPDQFPMAIRTQLHSILHGPPQPVQDRPLHPGQFWHLSPPMLPHHPVRTIYEILLDPGAHGHHYARPWIPMNPHSHLNSVPGDIYSWTPTAPHSDNTNSQTTCLHNLPPAVTWKKILCQPTMHADQSGRLLRRILSITNTEPPQMARDCPATQPPPTMLVELTQPPPTAYTKYVDGGWDTINADFTTACQEQRDPTN